MSQSHADYTDEQLVELTCRSLERIYIDQIQKIMAQFRGRINELADEINRLEALLAEHGIDARTPQQKQLECEAQAREEQARWGRDWQPGDDEDDPEAAW